jgi:hypothetical protein
VGAGAEPGVPEPQQPEPADGADCWPQGEEAGARDPGEEDDRPAGCCY